MSYRGTRRRVGKCFACGAPVFAGDGVWRIDTRVVRADGRPIKRVLHTGACVDRFDVGNAPRIEGASGPQEGEG
jgi:hypothetical protein